MITNIPTLTQSTISHRLRYPDIDWQDCFHSDVAVGEWVDQEASTLPLESKTRADDLEPFCKSPRAHPNMASHQGAQDNPSSGYCDVAETPSLEAPRVKPLTHSSQYRYLGGWVRGFTREGGPGPSSQRTGFGSRNPPCSI